MNRTARRTSRGATLVYVVLVGLTLVTWWLGRSGAGGLAASLLVLGFALFKGHLVGDWFMGLRRVTGIWRWVVVVWLAVPGALITVAFTLAHRG